MAHPDQRLFDIARRAAKAFASLPNVHAVGLGGRERDGKPTGEIVLKVFVTRKARPDELEPAQRIPATFEGIPTDVVPASVPRPQAAIPSFLPRSEAELDAYADRNRERPLRGGTCLMPGTRAWTGTLGFLGEALGDNRQVFAVTNYHVAFSARSLESTAQIFGQPTPDDSCTACCRSAIGKFFGGFGTDRTLGDPDTIPDNLDYALIRLDPGLEWLSEVKDIGVVQDTYELRVADTLSQTYQIRKRGYVTRLTGGSLHAIAITHLPSPALGSSDAVYDEKFANTSIAVRPNPDPAQPGVAAIYSEHGDSGAAMVNDSNQLVAILWGGGSHHTDPAPARDHFGEGWGVPIRWILDDINNRLGITLRLLPTAGEGIVNTVPDVSPAEGPPVARAERSLERDLDATERGRAFLRAWLRHSGELNGIIQSQRRVATVWQRHNGPALLRLVARAPLEPNAPLPTELDGVPVREGLNTFLDQIDRYASVDLKRDLAAHRHLLLSMPGKTYAQVLGQLQEPVA